jgi:hypothetical protein
MPHLTAQGTATMRQGELLLIAQFDAPLQWREAREAAQDDADCHLLDVSCRGVTGTLDHRQRSVNCSAEPSWCSGKPEYGNSVDRGSHRCPRCSRAVLLTVRMLQHTGVNASSLNAGDRGRHGRSRIPHVGIARETGAVTNECVVSATIVITHRVDHTRSAT